jgi:omega-amidase
MTKLAAVQIGLKPGEVAANVGQALELLAEAAAQGAALAVLPECFSTGLVYGQMEKLAEPVPGPTADALCRAAAEHGLWISAGLVQQGPEKPFNAAVVINPAGEVVHCYHKSYLYMREAEMFARGDQSFVADCGFARAGVLICYDYVFPEYVRGLVVRGANLLAHSTAWVDSAECRRWNYPAVEAYRAQNRVRALENGITVVSANNSGPYDSAAALECVGHSTIIAPWGEVLAELESGPGVAVAEVDFSLAGKWSQTAAPYLHDHLHCPRPY